MPPLNLLVGPGPQRLNPSRSEKCALPQVLVLLTSDAARARAEGEKRAAAAAAARGVSETYTVRALVAVCEGDAVGLQCALGGGMRHVRDLLGAYLGRRVWAAAC